MITGSFTWAGALADAATQSFMGFTGHLVTITTADEQAFLNTLTSGTGNYHIAASDSLTEDDWKWVAGPEAGQSFWISGVTQPGFFANWAPSEPNNLGGAEDVAVGNWSAGGTWNDISGTSDQVLSYVVEFSVPAPATLALFGLGLAGLRIARRKRRA